MCIDAPMVGAHERQMHMATRTRTKPTKGGKAAKTTKAKATTTTTDAVPGSLADLTERFIAHLERSGKTTTTVRGYGSDLKVAQRVLGADTKSPTSASGSSPSSTTATR